MTIGLIVAMDKEFRLVVGQMSDTETLVDGNFTFVVGRMAQHRVVAMQCGIGKVAAAVGATTLIRQFAPDCVINTGVAGALDSHVGVMDVVVGTRTVYHDVDCFTGNPHGMIQGFPLYYEGDEALLDAIRRCEPLPHVHFGLICSGDQFISKLADIQAIKHYFPEGLAVDMESCAIAQVCYMHHMPFVSLRVVSDTPGVNAHEQQYNNFWTEAPETSFVVLKKILEAL